MWDQGKKFVDGHYQLPIPFKVENPNLPDNRVMTAKRLKSLEHRLCNNPKLRVEYTEEVVQLKERGFAEKVEDNELKQDDGKVWYLPHHAVLSPNKPRVRIVFDCAAKFQGGSLNEAVHLGPDLTSHLVGFSLGSDRKKLGRWQTWSQCFNR